MSNEQPRSRARDRMDDAFHKLHAITTHHVLALMNGASTEYVEKAEGHFSAIEQHVEALEKLVTPAPAMRALTLPQEIVSLASVLVALAREVDAGLYEKDALHAQVVAHALPDEQAYWAGQSEHRIYGLIRFEKDVAQECAKAGVLVEARDDKRILLVNSNWLGADADKRALIVDRPYKGGRRCEFCGVAESGTSFELQPVEPEQRSKLSTINGIVQLQVATVHTHRICEAPWRAWLAIAERYASAEAAEEADRAAGRERRELVAPERVAEAPKPERKSHGPQHVNASEQRTVGTEPKVDTGRKRA